METGGASALFPIPPRELLALKKMPRSEAEAVLRLRHPHLEDDVKERLLALALPDAANAPPGGVQPTFDPSRRVIMAALWIAGGSMNQIAALYGIARQSVQQQIDRVFPAHMREAATRLAQKLPYDRMGVMRDRFNAGLGEYGVDPVAVAAQLYEDTEDWDA